MSKRIATIKILKLPQTDVPSKILLQKFCLLRTAEKVGDTETVNMYQLGKLKSFSIEYIKIS